MFLKLAQDTNKMIRKKKLQFAVSFDKEEYELYNFNLLQIMFNTS